MSISFFRRGRAGKSSIPAPVNTVLPVITGIPRVDDVLSVSNGSWSNSPVSFTYQWKKAGVNISGATSAAYIPVVGDIGSTVTCTVTAVNPGGSTAATSAATSIIAAASPVVTFGAKTLSFCGGKSVPGWTSGTLNPYAISGNDAPGLATPSTCYVSGSLGIFSTAATEGTSTQQTTRGQNALFGIWLNKIVPRNTAQYAASNASSPRVHGDIRVGGGKAVVGNIETGTYDVTYYDGSSTYPVTITVVPYRADVATIGELRATLHDRASNLRNSVATSANEIYSVYLQNSIDYGSLLIDFPQTVMRRLASDGTTVLTDWTTSPISKGANEIIEMALYGNPDSVNSTGTVVTTNDPKKLTRLTGPGTVSCTVPTADTMTDLVIYRGTKSRTSTCSAAWPYDHSIGSVTAYSITGTNSSHWTMNRDTSFDRGYMMPVLTSTGYAAHNTPGPGPSSYTLTLSLTGTRTGGSPVTKTLTINMRTNTVTVSNHVDIGALQGSANPANGWDIRGITIEIAEYGEEDWYKAYLSNEKPKALNGRTSGSMVAATQESHRVTIQYANTSKKVRFNEFSITGATYVTVDGLQFYPKTSRTAVGTGAGVTIDVGYDSSIGTNGGYTILKNLYARNSYDKLAAWKSGPSCTPYGVVQDCDMRQLYIGFGSSNVNATYQDCIFGEVLSNCEFIKPGNNYLVQRVIYYGMIYDETNAGNHADLAQWGLATTTTGYTNATRKNCFMLIGPTITDSDGMVLNRVNAQGPFYDDVNNGNNKHDVALVGGGWLTVGQPVGIILEECVIECVMGNGILVNDIDGTAVVARNTLLSRVVDTPSHPRFSNGTVSVSEYTTTWLKINAETQLADGTTKYQTVATVSRNIAPIVNGLAVTSNGSSATLNYTTGAVAPTTFCNGGTIDWTAGPTALMADLIDYYKPKPSRTEVEVGDGTVRGALKPTGVWNDGT